MLRDPDRLRKFLINHYLNVPTLQKISKTFAT